MGDEIDPTDLKKDDKVAWDNTKSDWQDQTGFTLKLGKTGLLEIDKKAGIKRDENGKKIGSRAARRLLKRAIKSKETIALKKATNDMQSSQADRKTNEIFIKSSTIIEGMGNAVGIDPKSVGFGLVAFHELSHIVNDVGDLPPGVKSSHKGENVPIINQIRKQLGYDTRRSYGIYVGNYIYLPFDRSTKTKLKNKIVPASGKYTRYWLLLGTYYNLLLENYQNAYPEFAEEWKNIQETTMIDTIKLIIKSIPVEVSTGIAKHWMK